MRDQTVHFNDVMHSFVEHHGFEKIVTLRHKIRNFSSLHWWKFDLTKTRSLFAEANQGLHKLDLQLHETEEMRERYVAASNLYEDLGREADLVDISDNRSYALKVTE